MSGGHCLCGAVRFAVAGDPITVRECWCRDCQYLASGGPTRNVFFGAEQVEIAGEPRWFESPADSGNMLARGFCPTCGTHLFVRSHARQHLIGVRLGTFDDRDALAPRSAIWTASAPSWAMIDPAIPHEPRQPPPLG